MSDIEWEKTRVIRTPEGILCREHGSGWWLDEDGGRWGTSSIDDMAWRIVVIDADGRNVEAVESNRRIENDRLILLDELESAERRAETAEALEAELAKANRATQKTLVSQNAELVRQRETALRDLRKAERYAEGHGPDCYFDLYEAARKMITDAGLETYKPNGSEIVASQLIQQQQRITELEAEQTKHNLANNGCVPADAYRYLAETANELEADYHRARLAYQSARDRARLLAAKLTLANALTETAQRCKSSLETEVLRQTNRADQAQAQLNRIRKPHMSRRALVRSWLNGGRP